VSDSFAGITVPQGEPGSLRSAASQLKGVSGALDNVSSRLRSSPGLMSSWAGPASVSYAGSCLTNGAAASAGTRAISVAGQALGRYATDLEDAQEDAKQAIRDAREAKRKMDDAMQAIGEAQQAAGVARQRYADATTQASLEAMAAGGAGGSGLAQQAQAQQDIEAAEDREAAARRAYDRAKDDYEQAQKRGNRAEERARDAARSAAGALSDAGVASPAFAAPGAPASPEEGGLAFGEHLREIIPGVAFDGGAGAFRGYSWYRGHTRVSGYVNRYGTAVAPYMRKAPQYARWAKYAKAAERGSVVFAGAFGGFSQYEHDEGKGYTTSQRVVRTGAGAANDAVLSWGGAASGAAIGSRVGGAGGAAIGSAFPVVGTGIGFAVGTAGGAIVGGVAGSGAGALVASYTRDTVADGAQWVGDTTDKGWDATAGARHAVADGLDKINPF
jgi:uncharacterized protein YukE